MDVTMTRRTFLGATACTVAVAGTGFGEEPPKTEITFLNLACTDGGAGLAVVLRTPTVKTYLFDTGNGFSPEHSNGAAIVVPWLKANKEAAMAEIAAMSPKPKIVVASLGNRPWMMNCGKACVQAYGKTGYQAYSTNVHGDVTVAFAGGEPTVSTYSSKLFPVEEAYGL